MLGTQGDDVLIGTEGSDLLEGLGGHDVLDGRGGADIMDGGAGNDQFYVDHANDQVLERAGEGSDRVWAATSYVLSAGSSIEMLTTTNHFGMAAINLTGNELDQSIYGNDGDNILNGGGGADLLVGRLGNDQYFVDSMTDTVSERAGEGYDRVWASSSYTLTAGSSIERLTTTNHFGTGAINLTGNEYAQDIYGNDGDNILNGGGGADWMYGRAGSDHFYVDDANDLAIERDGEGYDRVWASSSYTLTAGSSIERLTTTDHFGTAAISLAGNEYAQDIYGNDGDNTLNGGGGADWMYGRAGSDQFYVDDANDLVFEREGEGYDRVWSSVNYVLSAGSSIERLTTTNHFGTAAINLAGNEFAQDIFGNDGDNIIDGGRGDDWMYGRAGNDQFFVDSANDLVFEQAGEGQDRIWASTSYTLSAGSSIELITTTNHSGTAAVNLAGNELGQTIYGNAGTNLLTGGGGADALYGLGGIDTFAFTAALGSANVAIVGDFSVAEDRILLGGAAGQPFAALASGALGAGAFRLGSAALDADDRIIYNPGTGALSYDADGAGGAAAVQFATLSTGLTNLAASSFTVSGGPNNLPVMISGSTASVAENSAASTVVYTAAATDADGDRIVYTLSGQHADRFSIDGATGQVRLNSPADYESLSSYNFTVNAVDSSGFGSSRAVVLTVTDVAEPPPGGSPYVVADAGSNDTAGTAQALDRGRFTPVSDGNVPDGSLPTARIQGEISPNTDADFFTVTLQEGELLILDVDGTTSLDSLIRVFGPTGLEVAENDDQVSFDAGSTAHSGISHNLDSLVRFRAPTSGTYTFSIQSFADTNGPTSSGSYVINVSIGPVATRAQIDEENIQSLITGAAWGGGSVTYGFTTSASQYGANEGVDEKDEAFEALNFTQQSAVRQIVGQVGGFTNLGFTELSANPGAAQMRYAMSDDPNTAHAYYPGTGNGGDSWYNNSGPLDDDGTRGTPRYDNPVVGNYGYLTFVHETGHALGLKHGHESPALSPDRDSMEFSVMTYRGYINAPTGENGGYKNETWGFAQTFMMYDIAALQRMYGADFTYNAGDSIYTWSPGTGAFLINGSTQWTPGGNRVFMTIWDGGGNDTYDLSNYAGAVTIDLRPGEWTTTSAVQLANLGGGNMARGNVANALLFSGDTRSLIENAIGGSGNDVLIANQAVNRLTGGGGADVFRFNSVSDSGRGVLSDTITDFASGTDRIDLSGIDANGNTAGDDAFTFIGSGAFTGAAGQLRYEVSGNSIRLLGDINGDSVADFELVVNSPVISQPDFIL
jgi:Ca2+-binding RTX toxin-like protein